MTSSLRKWVCVWVIMHRARLAIYQLTRQSCGAETLPFVRSDEDRPPSRLAPRVDVNTPSRVRADTGVPRLCFT